MSVFFVGGIHGSGKSTLCRQLSVPLQADHLIASELIEFTPDPHDLTRKGVVNVAQNQDRLLRALSQRKHVRPNVLLDGHFSVFDRTGRIVRIPVSVFREINPAALLLVEAEPSKVRARLGRRDRRTYDLDLLTRLTSEERFHARDVSRELGIPLRIWRVGNGIDEAVRFLLAASRTS